MEAFFMPILFLFRRLVLNNLNMVICFCKFAGWKREYMKYKIAESSISVFWFLETSPINLFHQYLSKA